MTTIHGTDREAVAVLLAGIPMFSALTTDDFAGLAALTNQVTRNDGQVIFRQGDAPLAMFVIRSGKVAVSV